MVVLAAVASGEAGQGSADDSALGSLQQLEFLGTTDPQSYLHFRAGVRYQQHGAYAEAEACYLRALDLDSGNRGAQINLQVVRLLTIVDPDYFLTVDPPAFNYRAAFEQIGRALSEIAENRADPPSYTAAYHLAGLNAFLAEELEYTGGTLPEAHHIAVALRTGITLHRQHLQKELGEEAGRVPLRSRLGAVDKERLRQLLLADYLDTIAPVAALLEAGLLIRSAVPELEDGGGRGEPAPLTSSRIRALTEAQALLDGLDRAALDRQGPIERAAFSATRALLLQLQPQPPAGAGQLLAEAHRQTLHHLRRAQALNKQAPLRINYEPILYPYRWLEAHQEDLPWRWGAARRR